MMTKPCFTILKACSAIHLQWSANVLNRNVLYLSLTHKAPLYLLGRMAQVAGQLMQ